MTEEQNNLPFSYFKAVFKACFKEGRQRHSIDKNRPLQGLYESQI